MQPKQKSPRSFAEMMAEAYIAPMRVEGGFPGACLAMFIFSLGSAPMFFLLLMARDIIGIGSATVLQLHFSFISMLFFICAALSASIGALATYLEGEPAFRPEPGSAAAAASIGQASYRRWALMVLSCIAFSGVVCLIPACGLFNTYGMRLHSFYILAGFFGIAFGSVYARFQECTWTLLPEGSDIANLMGFATMSKLGGVGLGNFGIGFVLDQFSEASSGTGTTYALKGYFFMCAFCAFVVALAAAISWNVGRTAMALEQVALRGREADAKSTDLIANPQLC